MPLSAGLATIADGDIELGEFKSTVSEMYVEAPTGDHNAKVPPQLAETYPRWNLGRDYPETARSEEHTSELQSLMRISYAVFCLKKKTTTNNNIQTTPQN